VLSADAFLILYHRLRQHREAFQSRRNRSVTCLVVFPSPFHSLLTVVVLFLQAEDDGELVGDIDPQSTGFGIGLVRIL